MSPLACRWPTKHHRGQNPPRDVKGIILQPAPEKLLGRVGFHTLMHCEHLLCKSSCRQPATESNLVQSQPRKTLLRPHAEINTSCARAMYIAELHRTQLTVPIAPKTPSGCDACKQCIQSQRHTVSGLCNCIGERGLLKNTYGNHKAETTTLYLTRSTYNIRNHIITILHQNASPAATLRRASFAQRARMI